MQIPLAAEELSATAQSVADALKALSPAERAAVLQRFGAVAPVKPSQELDAALKKDAVDDSKDAGGKKEFKPERDSFHFQTTIISQRHDQFNAPYSGPRSLKATEREVRTSESATLFAGWKLSDSTELYFNPEVSGGTGFSNSNGIAGFTNGDISRVGKPEPTPYVARLFVRETIGLGGETENIESSQNQVAETRDIHRLTLTFGKATLTDFFDNNSYSHDPRTQFLNWSLMDNGAWDFAADARGYSPGLVIDYNEKTWALRYGAFLEPTVANGPKYDLHIGTALAHNLEFEYRYSFFDHNGILRPLFYLNRANMGSYREALDEAEADSTVPKITHSREFRTKYGAGINLEQAIYKDLGTFLRAGWNDGHTESWAFTEIDRTASLGLSLNGTRWGRPNDTIGIAGVINGISPEHRDYLAAGGIGFIIGDGKLNYSTERIVETYYNMNFHENYHLSVDYQRVNNPAYNHDRGPVNVASIRFHLDL